MSDLVFLPQGLCRRTVKVEIASRISSLCSSLQNALRSCRMMVQPGKHKDFQKNEQKKKRQKKKKDKKIVSQDLPQSDVMNTSVCHQIARFPRRVILLNVFQFEHIVPNVSSLGKLEVRIVHVCMQAKTNSFPPPFQK